MNVTEHILERYCERILLIPIDDIKKYLNENRNLVISEVLNLYEKKHFVI